MEKHAAVILLSAIFMPLAFAASAKRLPESCMDSTPSIKDFYAPCFTVGAASYADGTEEDLIKDMEKDDKKKAKKEKKKEKAAEKERKKAEKERKKAEKKSKKMGGSSSDGDYDDYDDYDEEDGDSLDSDIGDQYFIRTVKKHFAELSSGTELLPVKLLGKRPTKFEKFTSSTGYRYDVPAKWNSEYLSLFLEEAQKAGVQVRFHLLVCPEMTPEWFFFRGYDSASRLASKSEMEARLDWYIKTVTDFISDWERDHNRGKILVTSYDVASELFTDAGDLNKSPYNHLAKIFGDSSYAGKAFSIAAKYVPDSVKLCYCDHSLFEAKKAERVKEFISSVRSLDRKSRVDEIGIISHLTADWPDREAFFAVCRDFAKEGLDVQIQQLDMAAQRRKESGNAYYDFMTACIENAAYIKGVSFRAVKAPEETEFIDYMRAPLFSSDYSCNENFDRVIEAAERGSR